MRVMGGSVRCEIDLRSRCLTYPGPQSRELRIKFILISDNENTCSELTHRSNRIQCYHAHEFAHIRVPVFDVPIVKQRS